MIRKKVLGVGATSATMLVEDSEEGGKLCVLRRLNVSTWTPVEVKETVEMYDAISKANLPTLAEMRTVMLQGSFLNLLTTYYPRGDLESYAEDGSKGPFDEARIVDWLLAVAKLVEQVQRLTGGCFYGISPDRIFFSDNCSVGVELPLPRPQYFKWLEDREARGVAVEREYPPEVWKRHCYEPNASDVWHIGHVGMKMLGAHTSYFTRSAVVRGLIAAMMEANVARRMRIGDVVRRLTEMAQENNNHHHRHSNSSDNVSQALGVQTGVSSSLNFALPLPHDTPGRATAPSTDTSDDDTDIRNKNGRKKSLGDYSAVDENEHLGRTARGERKKLSAEWHRRAMEQFEELQRLNAMAPVGRSADCSPVPRHKRIMSAGSSFSHPHSARGLATTLRVPSKRTNTPGRYREKVKRGSFSTATNGAKEGMNKVQRILQQQADADRKRDILLKEYEAKQRKQEEEERIAQHLHRDHMEKMRRIRTNRDDDSPHDIRNYIKQWREQRKNSTGGKANVKEKAGTPAFSPVRVQPQQSPPWSTDTNTHTSANANKHTAAGPTTPSPLLPSFQQKDDDKDTTTPPGCPARIATPPPSTAPSRSADTYRSQGLSPRVPITRVDVSCTPPRVRIASITSHDANLAPSLVKLNTAGSSSLPIATTLPPSSEGLSDNSFPRETDKEPNSTTNTLSGENSKRNSLLPSIGSSIDGLNESLRELLGTHKRYKETISLVNTFVSQTETERYNSRVNTAFMNKLRNVVGDEKIFLAAAPLCAQMMALQGLLRAPDSQQGIVPSSS